MTNSPGPWRRWTPYATAAVLCGLLLIVPARRHRQTGGTVLSAASQTGTQTASGATPAGTDGATAGGDASASEAPAISGTALPASALAATPAPPLSSPPGGDTFSAASGGADMTAGTGSSAGSPPPSAPPTDSASLDTGAQPAAPLHVVASAWATSSPAGANDPTVPAGGLPVSEVNGSEAKRSYIRLAGSSPTLKLAVSSGSGANVVDNEAAIQACAVNATWTPAKGEALSGAPAYDPRHCVSGIRDATDGSWTFDFTGFGDPTEGNGLALVVGPGATSSTFQVVFNPGS